MGTLWIDSQVSKQVCRGSSVLPTRVRRHIWPLLHAEVSVTLPPEREIGRELAGAMHRSTGSYELVIAAIAAAALGFWIDSVVGTRPIVMIVFAVAGFIGAAYSIYLKYQAEMAEAEAARVARKSGATA